MPSSTRSTGDLQRGGGGALAVTGLQHVELAVLDGELHILHVAIVIFQRAGRCPRTARKASGMSSRQLGDGHAGYGRRPRRPRPER